MTPDVPEPETAVDDAPPSRWAPYLEWGERIFFVALLALVAVRLAPQVGALTGVGSADIGSPDYTFRGLDGEELTATELRGRVVVVNFWATWCGPCKLEMPSLQKLHERHADAGVVVLGLSVDVGGQRPVRAFLEERGITYPVGLATRAQRLAFGGIQGIPTTFVIDRSGTVRHRVVGYFAGPAMSAAVSRLLGEERPGP